MFTNTQKNTLNDMTRELEKLASKWDYWMDPKILSSLEMTYALIAEQMELEKLYNTEKRANDNFFSSAMDIPSVDDLEDML